MVEPGGRDAPLHIEGYEDFVEIGRGGTAVVYAATQVALGRRVAVKVLPVDVGDGSVRRRFERECAAIGALGDAPHVVAVYAAAVTDDGRGCIVMRLMRESLAARLRSDGPLSVPQVVAAGAAAARALDGAHSRGVLHRDVKPANLLLSPFDEVALADFDIAATADGRQAGTMTQGSMSPPHTPPERLRGDDAAGAAGDVWSLGSAMFTLLDGAPPFGTPSDDGGMAGLIDRVLHRPPPRWRRADVPRELDELVRAALSKDPDDRPDVATLVATLDRLAVAVGPPEWDAAPSPAVDVRAATRSARVDVAADRRRWGGDASSWSRVASTVFVVGSVAAALAVAVVVAIG